MSEYVKFRFTSDKGSTAGLVLNVEIYKKKTIGALSQMFPMREATKMMRLECSEPFGTWEDAFHYDFEKGE